MAVVVKEPVRLIEGFSVAQVTKWRQRVAAQREIMFHRNWRNTRKVVELESKVHSDSFAFIIGWYEEFNEVVGREKERNRLDGLIARGLDVNDPANGTPRRRASSFT